MAEIIKVNPDFPEDTSIKRAVEILKAGGVIAYPTETFYGLGAHAGNEEGVEKVFRIKRRPLNKPLSLIIGSNQGLTEIVSSVPSIAEVLMRTFWPGALTLLFPAKDGMNPLLTAGTGKIGLRVSSHPVAAALAFHLGYPITATSANISGEGECSTAFDVVKRLGGEIDAVIDGGRTWGGVGSTILDVTTYPPSLVREGAISFHLLETVWKRCENFT